MIHAFCRTNLDEFKMVEWPKLFVEVPRLGDGVEGKRTGPGPGSHPVLYVCAITHRYNHGKACIVCVEPLNLRYNETQCKRCGAEQAYLEIELHHSNSVPKR